MEVLKLVLAVYLVCVALFTAWLRPSAGNLLLGFVVGIGLGLGYAYLFYAGRYKKNLLNEGVSPASDLFFTFPNLRL